MTSVWDKLRQVWIPTSSTRLAQAERRVLSVVQLPYEQIQIPIGDGLTINTIHIYDPKLRRSKRRSPLVLLHGFGAGVGFWLLNLDALAKQHGDVYAIDLLGYGRSSRPHFPAKTADEAERFFVNSLEQWRIQVNLDKMILLGHSLGGYISAAYAMSYPTRISHLILASPAGVPEEPDADIASNSYSSSNHSNLLRSFILFLWNRGYTPLAIVRIIGPMGQRPVNAYITRRFQIGPAADDVPPSTTETGLESSIAFSDQIDKGRLKLPKQDIAEYLYHLCAQPASGEFALPCFFKSNTYAYNPLQTRLGNSNVSHVTFLYGDNDWMDSDAGRRTVRSLNKRQNAAKSARLLIIPDAGHQLMIDNPDGFHQAIQRAIQDHQE